MPMGLPMDYNSYASKYAYTRKAAEWVITPLAGAIAGLPENSSILEIGCGTGNYIIALSEKLPDHTYYGFDLSIEMLKVAKSRSDIISFSSSNADESFPYTSNKFNLAFMVDVIHHITEYDKFFDETYRVLDTGGKLIIVTDSEYNFERRSLNKYFPETLEIERSRYPAIELLSGHASKAGFLFSGSRIAEGEIEITEQFINNCELKCSSATRLMNDEDHKKGIRRMKEALGKMWISSYTVLTYSKP